MMVLLRAFALVVVAVGAGALHHYLGPTIQWDIGSNEPLPDQEPAGAGPDGGATDAGSTPAPEGGQQAEPGGAEDPGDGVTGENAPDEPAAPTLSYNDLSEHVGLAGARLIYEMAANGEAAIVDARRVEEYAEGHIPLAFSIMPVQFVPGGVPPAAVEMMDPEQPVLIYCQGGQCDDSKNVGIKLRELGFKRLHIFDDGYPAWVDAGYEVEKGPPL